MKYKIILLSSSFLSANVNFIHQENMYNEPMLSSALMYTYAASVTTSLKLFANQLLIVHVTLELHGTVQTNLINLHFNLADDVIH